MLLRFYHVLRKKNKLLSTKRLQNVCFLGAYFNALSHHHKKTKSTVGHHMLRQFHSEKLDHFVNHHKVVSSIKQSSVLKTYLQKSNNFKFRLCFVLGLLNLTLNSKHFTLSEGCEDREDEDGGQRSTTTTTTIRHYQATRLSDTQ